MFTKNILYRKDRAETGFNAFKVVFFDVEDKPRSGGLKKFEDEE